MNFNCETIEGYLNSLNEYTKACCNGDCKKECDLMEVGCCIRNNEAHRLFSSPVINIVQEWINENGFNSLQ